MNNKFFNPLKFKLSLLFTPNVCRVLLTVCVECSYLHNSEEIFLSNVFYVDKSCWCGWFDGLVLPFFVLNQNYIKENVKKKWISQMNWSITYLISKKWQKNAEKSHNLAKNSLSTSANLHAILVEMLAFVKSRQTATRFQFRKAISPLVFNFEQQHCVYAEWGVCALQFWQSNAFRTEFFFYSAQSTLSVTRMGNLVSDFISLLHYSLLPLHSRKNSQIINL